MAQRLRSTGKCLFYLKDTYPIKIIINNMPVKPMQNMNVLGVQFDSKLTWSKHVSSQITTACPKNNQKRLLSDRNFNTFSFKLLLNFF